MIELGAIFIFSFSLALSGALVPGPLFTVTVADSASRGFISGPLLMTGHSLLELGVVAAVVLGLGPLIQAPPVLGTIALVGGGILLWMGAGTLRSATGASLAVDSGDGDGTDGGNGKLSNPILTGALASISNPYWTLWWATVGLGYLTTALKSGPAGVAAFFVGHISADFAWYSFISFGVSRGRKLIGDTAYQWILRGCGALLLCFGVWFLATSFGYIVSV